MAQSCVVPHQWHVKISIGASQSVGLVIAPCSSQTDTSHQNYIEEMRLALAAYHVSEIEEKVGIGGHIIPFVITVDGIISAFCLPAVYMQTCSDAWCEIMTYGE